jgi:uncharacterized protein (UPF0548 family)
MCIRTLANYFEVTDTLMTISENYRLCRHRSEPLVVYGITAACPVASSHDRSRRRSFRYAVLQGHPGNSTICIGVQCRG